MKRVFSCFLIAVFLVCLSVPLTVSALNYKIVNLNDMILVKYDSDLISTSLNFYKGVSKLSPQQAFFVRVLTSCGASLKDISASDLDEWESQAYKRQIASGDLAAWEAVNSLMSDYIYDDSSGVTYVAFSDEFCAWLNFWLVIWNELNDTSFSCSFVYAESLDSVQSYGYVIYRTTPLTYNDFLAGFPQIERFCLQSVKEYEPLATQGLSAFWGEFVSSLDINLLTSWLPDVVSSVIISRWAIFLSLAGVLVAIKILS